MIYQNERIRIALGIEPTSIELPIFQRIITPASLVIYLKLLGRLITFSFTNKALLGGGR